MYIGYYTPYSEASFILYFLSIIIFGLFYVYYYGLVAPPEQAIYNWLFMLLVFPKQVLPSNYMGVLLDVGFGIKNVSVSFYEILDVFIVLAMIVAMLTNRYNRKRNIIPNNVRILYRVYLIMVFVGILSLIRNFSTNNIISDINYFRTIFGRFPLYGGLWVILVGLVVFKASILFISTQKQVEKILMIMVLASVLLTIEFILCKYLGFTRFLPGPLGHYVFDLRGGFSSCVQSESLFVSQILILGVAASLYFFYKSRQSYYAILAIFFTYIILQTYQRAPFLAVGILSIILIYYNLKKISKIILYSLLIFVLIVGLSIDSSITSNKFLNFLSTILDTGNVKPGGYFGAGSTKSRIGASLRAIDVFLYDPIFGSGPGNLIDSMESHKIPKVMGKYFNMEVSRDFYEHIAAGLSPTNSHNLYIEVFCEYGMIGILVVLMTFFVIISNYRLFKKEFYKSFNARSVSLLQIKAFAYSVVIGFGVYYIFQAIPLLYGIFFLVLRFTFLNKGNFNAGCMGQTRDQVGDAF